MLFVKVLMEGWTDAGSRPTVYGSQKCFVFDDLPKPPADDQNHQNHQTTKTTKTT